MKVRELVNLLNMTDPDATIELRVQGWIATANLRVHNAPRHVVVITQEAPK